MHHPRLTVLVVMLGLLLPSFATLAAAQRVPSFANLAAQRCVVDLVIMNQNRRVTGDVDAECGRFHSAPFGNWGANVNIHPVLQSNGGSGRETRRRDGFQFSGWKVQEGWLQWNACTVDTVQFPRGNPEFYNDNNFTAQRAWPDVVNVSHTVRGFTSGPRNQSCADFFSGGNVAIGDVSLMVYELDRGPGDRRVATLSYKAVNADFHCSNQWLCNGESTWTVPEAGAEHVYAELKVAVQLRRSR